MPDTTEDTIHVLYDPADGLIHGHGHFPTAQDDGLLVADVPASLLATLQMPGRKYLRDGAIDVVPPTPEELAASVVDARAGR